MKVIKKITAIMLSIMMVLGMCSVVGADTSEPNSGRIDEVPGSISISNAKAGETYKIYRLLNLDSYKYTQDQQKQEGNYSYTFREDNKWKEFFTENTTVKNYFEIVDKKYVTVTNEGKDKGEEIAREALKYAEEKQISADGTSEAENDGTLTFSNLRLGYYLVESTVGSLCSLDTTNPTQIMAVKHTEPTVTKKVITNEGPSDFNTVNIGDTFTFQTEITVEQGAKNYVLYDEMDAGLELVELFGKIVTINNEDNDVPEAEEYTVVRNNSNGKDGFTLTFTDSYIQKQRVGSKITIMYHAKVKEDAPMDTAMINDTYLKYGAKQETAHSETKTYTFKIPVFKYTGTNTPLSGAKFKLYTNENCADNTEVKLKKVDDNNYRYSESEGVLLESPTSGIFNINGLQAGTYYLKEVEAPVGYNKLNEPIKITVQLDGAKNKHMFVDNNTKNIDQVNVENKSGSLLPSTGGMGITVFYIAGALLVLISGVVLIAKKRTDSK